MLSSFFFSFLFSHWFLLVASHAQRNHHTQVIRIRIKSLRARLGADHRQGMAQPRDRVNLRVPRRTVSGLSAFTAVTAWNLPSVAYPSYMVLISVILVAPLLRRRKPKPGVNHGPKGHGVPSTLGFAGLRAAC